MRGFLSRVRRTSNSGDEIGKSGDSKPLTPSNNAHNGVETTPKADVALPRRERRRSSFVKNEKSQALKDLALLTETTLAGRESLFREKLRLCCIMFNFEDPESDSKGKELKRDTLLELAEYVNTPSGQKIFTEGTIAEVVAMVRKNLFRTLPAQVDDFDPEEDEPTLEPAWPHLQVVYEFFLRFVTSPDVNLKIAKKFIDHSFIFSWIELFDAEDPRERDYVKTVLHRMYGKFMSYRSFIRRNISQVFYKYIYETGRHNGILELLEILGSIINGFAIPLKQEHVNFLERALIPLHKPKSLSLYHSQLSYCISQYVEKEPATFAVVLSGLIRFWPWTCSSKQVLMLNELEEILEQMKGDHLVAVQEDVYKLLAMCVGSDHFQVVERALYFWNTEHLCATILSQTKAHLFLPHMFGPLNKNSTGHWNNMVETLAQGVLRIYMEMDMALYNKCAQANSNKQKHDKADRAAAAIKWEEIRNEAKAKGVELVE